MSEHNISHISFVFYSQTQTCHTSELWFQEGLSIFGIFRWVHQLNTCSFAIHTGSLWTFLQERVESEILSFLFYFRKKLSKIVTLTVDTQTNLNLMVETDSLSFWILLEPNHRRFQWILFLSFKETSLLRTLCGEF